VPKELAQRDPAKEVELDPRITGEVLEKALKELPREKTLTPFKVSTRLGIPISSAKRILRLLESKGVIRLYSQSRRNPIYVPVAQPGEKKEKPEKREQPKKTGKGRKKGK
jgi:small subunit ribosomal protein S25e